MTAVALDRFDISVVVPCRNEASSIKECLRSILAQQGTGIGLEVLVVDGMSDDGTREIVESVAAYDQRVRLVDNPARITPTGLNIGIRAARGEWIARMDAHAVYAEDYLAQCLETAQRTRADNVGGAVLALSTTYLERAIAATHHSRFSSGGAPWHRPGFEGWAESVWGGFYRRDTLLRIGLYDEALVRNQDDELNLRLHEQGGRIWQSPKIRCWYRSRGTLRQLFRQYLQYGYWKVAVIQRHRSVSSPRHLAPAALVTSLSAGMSYILLSRTTRLIRPSRGPTPTERAASIMVTCVVATYVGATLAASVSVARREGTDLLPALPVTFATYHAGYGIGFVLGLFDLARSRRPRETMAEVTRIGVTHD